MNQPLTKSLQIESRLSTDVAAATGLNSGGGLVIENVMQAMEVAKLMAISGIAVRKHLRDSPGACLGIVIQSMDWGMSPYAVANKSYSVNDQLAYESQLIQAVILRRAPIKDLINYDYEGEDDSRICIASAETLSGKTVVFRSPKLGKISPKNSPLWKTDPDQQLSYYSGRGLCRRYFPDVLLGVYDVDELGTPDTKDVTPKGTGLADRLQAANQTEAAKGGFNPEVVAAALDETGVDWNNAEQASAAIKRGELPDGYSFADGVLTIPDQPPTENIVRGASMIEATFDEIVTVSGKVVKSKSGGDEIDPEVERAGAQAFIDDEKRQAPDDLSPAQCVAWLKGYDAVKGGAQ